MPGSDEAGVVEPVFIAGRFINEAALAHYVHQPAREKPDCIPEEESDRYPAILRTLNESQASRTELDAAAEALNRSVAPGVREGIGLRRHHVRSLGRDVDVLPDAVALTGYVAKTAAAAIR